MHSEIPVAAFAGHVRARQAAASAVLASPSANIAGIAFAAGRNGAADPDSDLPPQKENADTMLLSRLQDILEHRKLNALFQPIIDVQHGEIIGYEGLIRGP